MIQVFFDFLEVDIYHIDINYRVKDLKKMINELN